MSRKICIYCNKRKNPKSFPKHKNMKDGLDTRCKKCIKQHARLRHKLSKKAPNKPNHCECCGQTKKLCLDHNHKTNLFRGWICDHCNTAIGRLGDDISGVINAVNYLIMSNNRSNQYESIKKTHHLYKNK